MLTPDCSQEKANRLYIQVKSVPKHFELVQLEVDEMKAVTTLEMRKERFGINGWLELERFARNDRELCFSSQFLSRNGHRQSISKDIYVHRRAELRRTPSFLQVDIP